MDTNEALQALGLTEWTSVEDELLALEQKVRLGYSTNDVPLLRRNQVAHYTLMVNMGVMEPADAEHALAESHAIITSHIPMLDQHHSVLRDLPAMEAMAEAELERTGAAYIQSELEVIQLQQEQAELQQRLHEQEEQMRAQYEAARKRRHEKWQSFRRVLDSVFSWHP